jgi:hypothetical protein
MFWLWQKDFGKKTLLYEKRARKMLMKLTTGASKALVKCR